MAVSSPCIDHMRAMHEQQVRGQCIDYHQASQRSLNAGCLPAVHPCQPHAASSSPTSWASIALQQLALQRMQGCAAHNLNLASSLTATPAPAGSNFPAFNLALLRQLCGPAGVGLGVGGIGAGPLLAQGVAAGLPFAPLQPAYGGAAGLGGFARGAWGM